MAEGKWYAIQTYSGHENKVQRLIQRRIEQRDYASARAVLPHPSVFLVDCDGVVRAHSVDRNYKKRTTMRTVLNVLQELPAT